MLISFSLRNLFRNKRSTIFALIIISFGLAALLFFYGFNTGGVSLRRWAQVYTIDGHGQIFQKGYRGKPHNRPWDLWLDNYEEIYKVLIEHPDVEYLFPRVKLFPLVVKGDQSLGAFGIGIDALREGAFFIIKDCIKVGEYLKDKKDGIIIGKGLAKSLSLKPGDKLTLLAKTSFGYLNGVDLTLTGLMDMGQKKYNDKVFFMDIGQAQKLLDTNKVESIAIGLKDWKSWDRVEKYIEKKFPGLDAVSVELLDKFYYLNVVNWLNDQYRKIRIVILIIVLLGIFTTTTNEIFKRKSEIGNLRANGEGKFDVIKLLSFEGLFLGFIGASCGILLTLLLVYVVFRNGVPMPPAPGITEESNIMVELSLSEAFFSFFLIWAVTIFASFLAAIRASQRNIAECLRSF